jgi:hypothetical protein
MASLLDLIYIRLEFLVIPDRHCLPEFFVGIDFGKFVFLAKIGFSTCFQEFFQYFFF